MSVDSCELDVQVSREPVGGLVVLQQLHGRGTAQGVGEYLSRRKIEQILRTLS